MAGENNSPIDPELAAIAANADATLGEQSVIPGAAPAESEQGPNQAEQIGGLLTMGVMMAAPALPFLPGCYTPEVISNIATAGAAVCDKYGWSIGDVMSPELILAVAVLPPSVQAFVMFKQWKAQKAAEAEAAQRHQAQPTQGPGAMLPMLPAPSPGG